VPVVSEHPYSAGAGAPVARSAHPGQRPFHHGGGRHGRVAGGGGRGDQGGRTVHGGQRQHAPIAAPPSQHGARPVQRDDRDHGAKRQQRPLW
jgi:hypothetical protein